MPKSVVVVLTALLLSPLAEAGDSRYLSDIPDFTQTEVVGRMHGNGQQYCAPAAVSNSLIWLSDRSIEQKQLVTLLASDRYMNTDVKMGTGTSELLRGVDRYVKEEFGGYRVLLYQGWRKHPSDHSTNLRVPALSFITRGTTQRSAAWINVGWYKVNAAEKKYVRIGGHWVALVDYNLDRKQLIIHDPAPRAGQTKSSEIAYLSTIDWRAVDR